MRRIALLAVVGSVAAHAAPPLRIQTRVDCHTEAATCQAVEGALATAARAERTELATGDVEVDDELVAKVHPWAVFFEVRHRGALQLITHTDEDDYRAPYSNQDAAVLLAFATIALAPIAYDLRHPTSAEDRARAWTVAARRAIRRAIRGGQRYTGAREGHGARWTIRLGAPEVRRHPVLAEGEILATDEDYGPPVEGDEALEASYSASLLLPELVRLLDEAADLKIGDGKATLVVQTIDQRFHPSLRVRDNAALAASLPAKAKLIPPRAPAIYLAGATRISIPIIVTAKKR